MRENYFGQLTRTRTIYLRASCKGAKVVGYIPTGKWTEVINLLTKLISIFPIKIN